MAVGSLPDAQRMSPWLDVIADPVRLQILRALCDVAEATAAELARRGPASYQTLRRRLQALQALGVIEARPGKCDGGSAGRPPVRYRLVPEARESVRAVFAAFA